MPSTCSVFGCSSLNENGNKLTFHPFPKDNELANKWVELCMRKGDDLNTKVARVCSLHFAPDAFQRNLQYELFDVPIPKRLIRLKEEAVPTLCLPGSPDQWEDLAAEETVKEEEHDILEDEFLHPIVVLEEGIPPKQEESDLTHKIIIKTNQSQSKHSDEPQRCQDRSPITILYWSKTQHVQAPQAVPAGHNVMHFAASDAAAAAMGPASSKSGWEQPYLSASGVEDNKCDDKNHLETSTSSHTKERKFGCHKCTETFAYESDLKSHGILTHGSVQNYECQHCSKIFTEKAVFTKHTYTHTGYICQQCGKEYPNMQCLTKHSVVHGPKNHECQQCGKRFARKAELNLHIQTHVGVRDHLCHECGKTFVRRANFLIHLKRHGIVKHYECQQCGKKFKTSNNLLTHKLTHADVKKYECKECGRRFTQKCSLNTHMKRHRGIKNFECQECGKRFVEKSNLTTHMKSHSGSVKYECRECGKEFLDKEYLKRHSLVHSDVKD